MDTSKKGVQNAANDSLNDDWSKVIEQTISANSNPFEINGNNDVDVSKEENSSQESISSVGSDSEVSTAMLNELTANEGNNPFSLQTVVKNVASNIDNAQELPAQLTKDSEDDTVVVKDKETKSNIYIFWISILSGLILSILLTINRGVIVKIWKGIKNNNFMILFQKEERNGNSVSFALLYLCFVLNLSAFITLIVKRKAYDFLDQSFFKIFFLVLSLVLLRHIVMVVIRLISNAKKEINNYYFSIVSINSLLGMVLIPINLLLAFGPSYTQPQVVFLGVIILMVCLITRWIKGITNSLRLIFNASFHFFLYLCTAEMLPLLIGIRIYLNLI